MSALNPEALELRRRLDRAGRTVAYLAISIPLAAAGPAAVLVLILGAALSVAGVGLPLLVAGAAVCRWLARIDRRAANHLLESHVPPLPPGPPLSGGPWQRALATLSDRGLWRVVALLTVKPVLTLALLAVSLVPIVLMAELAQLGIRGIGGWGAIEYIGPAPLGPVTGVVLCALVVPATVLVVAALDALHSLLCTITRGLLAPRATPGGPVREMLAESLGDRSLSIAYWLPDREAFVDEAGRPVEMPDVRSGRAWTAVERDGHRVAAIVHDVALEAGPDLVHAAAAASSLALDNERLKADLRARVEELRVSRKRIVEAGDAARRRLERDLHDGAQQQLVALALDLRLLRARLRDPEAEQLIDELSGKLTAALAELRELARGIHPAILTERGLGPAISAVADRVPVPVGCSVEVRGRLSPPVEAAVYFVVAEALTNVTKYARASRADVEVRQEDEEVLVLVSDDGVGAADMSQGTGLRGLGDRVAALDGTLTVHSPPGEGTRLRARIPARVVGPDHERPPAVLEGRGA
jgi:signal transduction histidine kinase